MTTSRAHNVVSYTQLVEVGHSDAAIKHLVASKRLFRRYRGVFAIGRPDLTQEGEWLAAVLACADGAALSHRSAALLWRLLEYGDGDTHVIVPYSSSAKGPAGVRLHRSRTLTEADIEVVNFIPVTSVVRTLGDLAVARLAPAPLEGAVLQAAKRYATDLEQLASRNTRLRRAVERYDPVAALTQSDLERRFLRLCRRNGLPVPECQVPFGPWFADFTWHEYKLVVETDGRGTHDTDERFRKDRVKDRRIRAAGYTVERFTRAEVYYEPAAVAAELRLIFARRARELGLVSL